MESNKIRELAGIMREHDLTELELEEGRGKLHLKRSHGIVGSVPTIVYETVSESKTSVPAPAAEQTVIGAPAPQKANDAQTLIVTSPLVGVFYPAPSPKEPPFVEVGQSVRAGDVLCLIEAMKLMNEIEAEKDGVITKVFPQREQFIEFGQELFEMRVN